MGGISIRVYKSRRGDTSFMVIIVVVGTLFAGGAVFAVLKNTGKRAQSKVTKLNIG
jgi:hypothetical protein